jgi:hypothetical protein
LKFSFSDVSEEHHSFLLKNTAKIQYFGSTNSFQVIHDSLGHTLCIYSRLENDMTIEEASSPEEKK